MENKNGQEFYTDAHLSKCIEIPIYTVTEVLNKFVKFKGLLTENVESTLDFPDFTRQFLVQKNTLPQI
ncbi:hypothetical protein NBRC116600_09310 [Thalassotalea sp. SU-HH00458]